MADWRSGASLVRPTAGRVRARLRSTDVLLAAAGVTFYAAISTVPGLLIALRIAAWLAGRRHVVDLGADLSRALPDALGAPDVVRGFVARAVDLRWWTVLVAVLPASLYGEGFRRALGALSGGPERRETPDRFTGWRGRIAVLPVLAAAPVLLLLLMAATPRVRELFGAGGWGAIGGVVVAFAADWALVSGPLIWVFRVVAPGAMSWPVAVGGGILTGSFVAGFLEGFVLFLSLPLDLGAPFGGLTALGGAVAVLLWLWVLHIVVLVGFVATRAASASAHSSARTTP